MFNLQARPRVARSASAMVAALYPNAHTLALAALLGLSACGEGSPPGEDAHAREEEAAHGELEPHVEGEIHLTPAQARAAGLRVEQAAETSIGSDLDLPAEIRFDPDRLARISVPIAGIVSDVRASEGDSVRAGQTLAVIASRELAELKSDYLDALTAEDLSRREAEREEVLWKERATSEASVQTRRAALARATAAREAAETKLHAIDIGHETLDNLAQSADGARANFYLRAPLDGQLIMRDATIGEAVGSGEDAEKPLFVVADASVVWADLAVYRQDLGRIEPGQTARIIGEAGEVIATGKISYVSPVIDEASRTATARVILDNAGDRLRPGQFVTARLALGAGAQGVSVAVDAIQSVDGAPAVFVPRGGGFVVRKVAPGQTSAGRTEVLSGLSPGESYVAEGAFTLKSELEKSSFGDGHAH